MKKILSVLIALLLLCTIVMAQPMEKTQLLDDIAISSH